jgi:hypothetical protein
LEERKVEEITKFIYPDKMTLSEFVAEIDTNLGAFECNIMNLPTLDQPKYIEDWFFIMRRWYDVDLLSDTERKD